MRAFASRDRTSVDALKRDHWASRFREEGAAAAMHVASLLYQHVRRARPDWPTPDDRAEDLTHHVELKRLLARTAGAFARR